MDLCNGSMWDKIILYTLPIVFSNLMQMLYNAVDIAVVGQYTGEHAVASVGSTASAIAVIVNVFIGISVGSSVKVAYYIGTGRQKDIEETVHTAIASAILFGGIGTVLGLVLARPLLLLLGTPKALMGNALLYMYVYLSGVMFSSLYNFGASILRSGGDTTRPMTYLLFSGLANVCFNYLLTGILGLGVIGVAAGTVLSQMISCALVLRRLITTTECYRLHPRHIRICRGKFAEIVKAGLPAGLQSAMYSLAGLLVQSSLNDCDLANHANNMLLAGNTASGTVEGIFTTCVGSFGVTVTTFTGQNYGAGKMDRVDRVPKLVAMMTAVVWVVISTVALLWAPNIVGFAVKDPVAIEYGALRFRVIIIGCILNMTSDIFIAQSRGLGNSFTPMIISIGTVCVFRTVYLTTVYPIFETYLSIILVFPITYALNTVMQSIFYRRTRKRAGQELEKRLAMSELS